MARYKKVSSATPTWTNQSLSFARATGDMLAMADAMLRAGLLRKESRGAHYRKDYQDRDDENFAKTSVARFNPSTGKSRHRVHPRPRSPRPAPQTHLRQDRDQRRDQAARRGRFVTPPRKAHHMSGAPAHEFDAQMRKENRKRAKQGRSVIFKIKRCDGPGKPSNAGSPSRSPSSRGSNVISCLQWIAANPVTTDGKRTTPVVWDSGCLEEVCGACTMVINGRARQSCSCLIDEYAPGEGDTDHPRAHEQVPGHPGPLGRP
jgi:hypothetical protein